mmetsp:Transcript_44631/g.114068  ORF Transcript_44631/g.114068 Transcript_44631/m.114068 type:complete len:253 (+) Transcript_44631:350-1108(+)
MRQEVAVIVHWLELRCIEPPYSPRAVSTLWYRCRQPRRTNSPGWPPSSCSNTAAAAVLPPPPSRTTSRHGPGSAPPPAEALASPDRAATGTGRPAAARRDSKSAAVASRARARLPEAYGSNSAAPCAVASHGRPRRRTSASTPADTALTRPQSASDTPAGIIHTRHGERLRAHSCPPSAVSKVARSPKVRRMSCSTPCCTRLSCRWRYSGRSATASSPSSMIGAGALASWGVGPGSGSTFRRSATKNPPQSW